jgi:threonine dehydratase
MAQIEAAQGRLAGLALVTPLIACAVRTLKPAVKIIACELETAHPLKAARSAGGPAGTPHAPGFVSGVGFGTVLPEMWPLVKSMIDEVITVSLPEVAAAIATLVVNNHVVAEGAGAVSVAAALSGRYEESKVCAVVSGGNLDNSMLVEILQGRVPG